MSQGDMATCSKSHVQDDPEILFDKEFLLDIHTKAAKHQSYMFTDFRRNFSRIKYYVQTKFTHHFIPALYRLVRKDESKLARLSVISGIGKTCATLFFVAKCNSSGKKVVYIDLNEVLSRSEEEFELFFSNLETPEAFIIDHVTLQNEETVYSIIKRTKGTKSLIIETGHTASGTCKSDTWGKTLALSEEEFTSIWMGTLTLVKEDAENTCDMFFSKESFQKATECCKPLYNQLKDKFLVTPWLAHFCLDEVLIKGYGVGKIIVSCFQYLEKEVERFPNLADSTEDIRSYIAQTGIIAKIIEQGGLWPLKSFESMRCAVNIFTYDIQEVTKEDCENSSFVKNHRLKEGEKYVKLSFVQPELRGLWLAKLKLTPDHVNGVESKMLQDIVPLLGKVIEESLVKSQIELGHFFFIKPASATLYIKTSRNSYLPENVIEGHFLPGIIIEHPSDEDIKSLRREICSSDGHLKNVALFTKWFIRKISEDTSKPRLLYPSMKNHIGIDYYLFVPSSLFSINLEEQTKKQKISDCLYLMQVTAAQSHCTKTVAKALDCVNEVIKSETNVDAIEVHLTFLTVRKDHSPYMLRDCIEFKNVSNINIANKQLLPYLTEECRRYIEAFLKQE